MHNPRETPHGSSGRQSDPKIGFTLQDDLFTENIVACSEAEALTLWLIAVNNPPAGDVRVWRRASHASSDDKPGACDVFRLRPRPLSRETWPLAQKRTDPRGWNEWEFVRREVRALSYTSPSPSKGTTT